MDITIAKPLILKRYRDLKAQGYTEEHHFPEADGYGYVLMINPVTMDRIRLYDHGLIDGPNYFTEGAA
jgi:hypothetical protein